VLRALHEDGTETVGESKIPEHKSPIKRMYIRPSDSRPTIEALESIKKASIIILGPGSLYTSVMPNLLIEGMYDAIRNSKAVKIYACNVMTQSGETDGYSASDHVKAIIEHTGRDIIDYCIINTEHIPAKLLDKYKEKGAYPVTADEEKIKALGCKIVKANLVDIKDLVRHDPHKLAKTIIDLAPGLKKHNVKNGEKT